MHAQDSIIIARSDLSTLAEWLPFLIGKGTNYEPSKGGIDSEDWEARKAHGLRRAREAMQKLEALNDQDYKLIGFPAAISVLWAAFVRNDGAYEIIGAMFASQQRVSIWKQGPKSIFRTSMEQYGQSLVEWASGLYVKTQPTDRPSNPSRWTALQEEYDRLSTTYQHLRDSLSKRKKPKLFGSQQELTELYFESITLTVIAVHGAVPSERVHALVAGFTGEFKKECKVVLGFVPALNSVLGTTPLVTRTITKNTLTHHTQPPLWYLALGVMMGFKADQWLTITDHKKFGKYLEGHPLKQLIVQCYHWTKSKINT